MNVLHRQVHFLLIACLVAIGTTACSPERSAVVTQPDSEISDPLSDVTESELPGVGKVLVKKVGWEIPALQPEGSEVFKAKPLEGVETSVQIIRYPQVFGTVRAPADATAAMRLGELNVQSISEYRADGHLFAYAFSVNRLYIDEATNTITGSQGVIMYYTLYDEDGDGIIETLNLNDKRFYSTMLPRVPEWAARKRKS